MGSYLLGVGSIGLEGGAATTEGFEGISLLATAYTVLVDDTETVEVTGGGVTAGLVCWTG